MGIEHEHISAVVRAVVNACDVGDLLAMGESREIKFIISAIEILGGYPTEQQLWLIICHVMHWSFGLPGEPVQYWPHYHKLATTIHQRLNTP